MVETIKYRLAESKDLDAIKLLLQKSGLPIADIDHNEIGFILAVNDKNELVGCIGVEQYNSDGLLRSFAVEPDLRGKRIGHELLNRLLTTSKGLGIKNLHLLTTTAEKFFSSTGFSLLSRNEAPASIKATAEFTTLCPSSSAYMVLTDIQNNS